jgi:2-polyprenyl-3-methyl-5-hydroxy-6-metoxy-1,4-benzoquinol methylase
MTDTHPDLGHQDLARLTRERWQANSEYWVKVIRERRDRYRTEVTDPALLDAVGPCEGLRVLDAGCGEGYLARELAARGAEVVGADSCRGLVTAAATARRPGTAAASRPGAATAFTCASVDALPLRDETFDLVVCNHLFSHLHDPAPAIGEFARVLRRGGRLVILTLHPCFYTASSERGATGGIPAAAYFTRRGVDQHFDVDGLRSPAMITSWLRPLEFYATTLRETGFVLADLREPRPTDEQRESDPWWHDAFPAALFLLLVAERR